MKIKSVSFSEKGRYVTILIFGEKKSLTIDVVKYRELGSPEKDTDVSEDIYAALVAADEYYRATVSALRSLSYSDNSRRRLYEKLRKRGISSGVARSVVCDMVSLGYLDEKKQLRTLVMRLANDSLFGQYRILAKLSSVGYSPSDVRLAIDELTDAGEIDFDKNFQRLLEKKPVGEDGISALKYKWGYRKC